MDDCISIFLDPSNGFISSAFNFVDNRDILRGSASNDSPAPTDNVIVEGPASKSEDLLRSSVGLLSSSLDADIVLIF